MRIDDVFRRQLTVGYIERKSTVTTGTAARRTRHSARPPKKVVIKRPKSSGETEGVFVVSGRMPMSRKNAFASDAGERARVGDIESPKLSNSMRSRSSNS